MSLFVSSTFEDMHAERDYLQRFVFPELQERLRKHRVHFQVVDLRWGVDTSEVTETATKQALVLKSCLGEIERSKPFFLVLLGDRYGWAPPPEQAEAAAREAGLEISVDELSVTALEISYALRDNGGMRPFFYFRSTLPYSKMRFEDLGKYTDEHSAPARHARQAELKRSLTERFPERVRRYGADWDDKQHRIVRFQRFGEQVLEDLWTEIQTELAQTSAAAPSWQVEEAATLDAFFEERSRNAAGRDDVVARLLDSAARGNATLIVGASGSGKSTVLALADQSLRERDDALVLAHSAGISARSSQITSLLRSWCGELAASVEEEDPTSDESTERELAEAFEKLLTGAAKHRPVVLIVDGLEQFERRDGASAVGWLPGRQGLPKNVTLLASSTENVDAEVLFARLATRLDVPPLDELSAKQLAMALCARYRKTLPPAVSNQLLGRRTPGGAFAAGNPLWLTLAVNELILADADDFAAQARVSGSADERLLYALSEIATRIPAETPSAYEYIYARAEGVYGEALTRSSLAFLTLARFALRESDLASIVPGWSSAAFAALRRALRPHLAHRGPGGGWSFAHLAAHDAAERRYLGGDEAMRTGHRALGVHFSSLPKSSKSAQDDETEAAIDADPFRGEALHHLLESGALDLAAKYWNDAEAGEELNTAFTILAQRILDPKRRESAKSFTRLLLDAGAFNDQEEMEALLASSRLEEFTEVRLLRPRLALDEAAELLEGLRRFATESLHQRRWATMSEVRSRALTNLGRLYANLQRWDKAVDVLEDSKASIDRLIAHRRRLEHEPNAAPQTAMFVDMAERDGMLNLQLQSQAYEANGEIEKARSRAEEAVAAARRIEARHRGATLAIKDLAGTLVVLGDLFTAMKRHEEADARFEEALDVLQPNKEQHPSEGLVPLLIETRLRLGRAAKRRFELNIALDHYGPPMTWLREAANHNLEDPQAQSAFIRALDETIEVCALAQRLDIVEELLDQSFTACGQLLVLRRPSDQLILQTMRCCERLAIVAELLGNDDDVVKHTERARYLATNLASGAPVVSGSSNDSTHQ